MKAINFKKVEGKKYPKPSDNGEGYVYIANVGPICKVGCTKKPMKRISNIKTVSGFFFTNVYFSQRHYSYTKSEAEIHKILKDYNISGEWFMIAPEKIIELSGCVYARNFNELVNHMIKNSNQKKKIIECLAIENLTIAQGVDK